MQFFFFKNKSLSKRKYIVAVKKAINDISEKSGIGSPPKKTLKDKHKISVAIDDENLFANEEIILKINKVVSVLKNKCVKRTEANKFPDVIIKKGTKNNWNIIGRHPLSLKIEITKFNASLFS